MFFKLKKVVFFLKIMIMIMIIIMIVIVIVKVIVIVIMIIIIRKNIFPINYLPHIVICLVIFVEALEMFGNAISFSLVSRRISKIYFT